MAFAARGSGRPKFQVSESHNVDGRAGRNYQRGRLASPGSGIGDITLGDIGHKAMQALSVANKAIALLNVEEKIFDNNGSSIALTAGGSVLTGLAATQLSAIAQGNQANQRSGDSIKNTKICFAGSWNAAASQVSSNGRVLIVRDNMGDQGAAPTLGSVLAFPTAPPAISSMLTANVGVTNERYTVLYDEVFTFPTFASGDAQPVPFAFEKPVKFHQDYLTGTTLGRNSIWLFTISDAVGASAQPLLSYQWRQFYVDN